MRAALVVTLLALAIAALTWLLRDDSFVWHVPEGKPLPTVPAENPMNDAKVELGKLLFYDTRLSVNQTTSCASCHLQHLAFTDGRARSVGATGQQHPRSSMSLVNVAYASRLTWANPLLDKLEDQALTPLLGDNPVEMGMGGREAELIGLLNSESRYRELLPRAFPDDDDAASVLNTVRSMASFVRTIISYDAPYDRYLAGEESALNDAAARGMDLFFSERFECFHCHGGFNFSDSTTHANAVVEAVGYHNTGLYNIHNSGAYPPDNTGLHDMTGKARDMGRFRAPSLRNVAVTAPYMHDGSIATLDEVLDHYASGGRRIQDGPFAGDGKVSPFKSEFVRGFDLNKTERADLLAFLESLTDENVLTNERWSNPW